jgi:uncharacterized protein (UPF0548 family)
MDDGLMTDDLLEASVADQLRGLDLTYAEVGHTRAALPSGYRHVRRRVIIGRGRDRFDHASRVVLSWDVHRKAGVQVQPSIDTTVQGTVAILRLGVGHAALKAPVRVVYTVDDDQRAGLAYGTLPGHPESGEEAFVVEIHDDDTVTFTITAFSRPVWLPARIAGPIGRAVQDWVTRRYLRALQR